MISLCSLCHGFVPFVIKSSIFIGPPKINVSLRFGDIWINYLSYEVTLN